VVHLSMLQVLHGICMSMTCRWSAAQGRCNRRPYCTFHTASTDPSQLWLSAGTAQYQSLKVGRAMPISHPCNATPRRQPSRTVAALQAPMHRTLGINGPQTAICDEQPLRVPAAWWCGCLNQSGSWASDDGWQHLEVFLLTRQTPSLRAALQRPLLPPPLMHRRSPGASTAHSGSGRARSGSRPALVLGACSCGWLKALVASRQPSATPSMSPITSKGCQWWQPNSSGKQQWKTSKLAERLRGVCSAGGLPRPVAVTSSCQNTHPGHVGHRRVHPTIRRP
jgi:hypothetical protein